MQSENPRPNAVCVYVRQVDPALLGLSTSAGNPPSKAFATLPACRALPGASVSLVSTPGASTNSAARRGGASATGGAGGGQGTEGEEEVLEVRPPPGNGGKVLRLRVLDGISLRVSRVCLPRCRATDGWLIVVSKGLRSSNACRILVVFSLLGGMG